MTNDEIEKYSNYIYSIMKRFKNYNNKEDLFQAGCIGLINAYNRFNPNMGAKFTTYAYLDILGEMYKLVLQDRSLKIGTKMNKLNLKIEKANILLSQRLYRYPTIKELSDYLEVEEELIENCLKLNNPIINLDETISNDGKEITYYDTISNNEIDYDTLVSLKDEINNLTEEEKYLLEKSLIDNYTQQEIATLLNINQVQVSRKITRIKEKIKQKIA